MLSFFLQKISTSALSADSVLVLMGRGLTDWLLQDEQSHFYPVPHAVPSLVNSDVINRAVFARMKVVPMNAVPISKGKKEPIKFEKIFFNTHPSKKASSSSSR